MNSSSKDYLETRASLLLRIRDPENLIAWQEFVEIYQPIVFRLALGRGIQASDCDDICQEVLTRVANNIESYDGTSSNSSFRGWLATITKNQTIDFFRQRNRLNQQSLDSGFSMNIPAVEESDFKQEHQKQLFLWAARNVKKNFRDRTWQAFWKTTVEEISAELVSKQLEMSVGQVYVNKSRVMSLLKETIRQSQFDSVFSWSFENE